MPSSPGPRPAGVLPRALGELTAGVAVSGVTLDSRAVRPGDLYAALPGTTSHGAQFAAQAVAAGAVVVLTDPAGEAAARATGVPVVVVPSPREVLGALAAEVYGQPARDLLTLGVTGTSGKTTTAYLLDAGLHAAGRTTGLVGTVETRIADEVLPSSLTTPEAPDLQALLAVMRERGCSALTMEVSSHALALGRVDGTVYDVAAFTNLGRDHLDFHPTLEDYFAAKALLFTPAHARRAVVCVDSDGGSRMAATARDAGLEVVTVSSGHRPADWRAEEVELGPWGSRFVASAEQLRVPVEVALPGAYNVANALLALATLEQAGVDVRVAAGGIGAVRVPGRMERVADGGSGVVGLVDYAHKPDAVEAALTAVRSSVGSGRIVAVLGAGGDRDRAKRPLMGAAAARLADVVVVTDDNPRSEDPTAIRAAVLEGAATGTAQVLEVGDRRAAIEQAVAHARPGDVVVVLGKGHEKGQLVRGELTPFDDRTELERALSATAGVRA
ncbi:UDP-N-acetylmuramoyl-L-alanyl-D-glutamate--2,6-diaminopimelate ligase [Motilibacter peucedani]|uniref:UDP-N-acetylmuramoyl-L-alanyl-D-glutamate--2,6-diaminopimelate ligase n=1 Tax=Motilibacter peucedani TaxID=598650 RepID=A0A420XPI4_9ACTN|nr:UDP-N-acetylmuramoyl-L-alanyl-D-glutamate--2,6-diaminopimelate ligase [Motilibacter peucedani]RKS74108.1 UDP-N-acetylmuramoyl-L-alanyl-D-glutamate--2,6-diaminopimelate ligase [Motilibacter peucedani]